MRLRLFAFAASLFLLATIGHVLVQMPYGEPSEPEVEGEAGEEAAPPEDEEALAEPAPLPPDEELVPEGEEVPDIETLRQQAEDAQRRVAEHLEAARQAQEEADRARRLAGLAPDELREAEEPEAPFSMEELVRRVEALEAQLAELQERDEASEEEIAALEEELEALEERNELVEQNRIQRIDTLDRGIDSMRTLFERLATGNADIEGALAQVERELDRAASEAARWAGEEEARLSAAAQRAVEAAREALSRRDLYAARIHLGIAIQQALAARRAAETAKPGIP